MEEVEFKRCAIAAQFFEILNWFWAEILERIQFLPQGNIENSIHYDDPHISRYEH